MKPININGPNPVQKIERAGLENAKSTTSKPSEVVSNTTADNVRISGRSEQLRSMVEHARSLPEVRSERVDFLRRLIDSGKYKVSAHDIADAIIRDEVR